MDRRRQDGGDKYYINYQQIEVQDSFENHNSQLIKRFCDGIINAFLKTGCIDKWLSRLQGIEGV